MMFNNRFSLKIFKNIVVVLLISSFVLALFFVLISYNSIVNNQRDRVLKQSEEISNIISRESHGMKNIQNKAEFINYANTFTNTGIYIYDNNKNLVNESQPMRGKMMNTKLVEESQESDKQIIRETRKGLFGYQITIATPLENGRGTVVVTSPIDEVEKTVTSGLLILLISSALSFVVAIISTYLISNSITKPIKTMSENTIQLINENYNVKNNIKQNDEIGELANNLNILSTRLSEIEQKREKLDNERKEFTANVSHEIKTPLTVIKSYVEALNDNIVSKDKEEQYYKQIIKEVDYLERLVNDLLDLSKLQDVNFQINKEVTNVVDVINDTINSLQSICKEKNIQIIFNNEYTVYKYMGDYYRLKQLILIIVTNAIKFSNENEVVKITFKDNCISIKDNGVGINDNELQHIFTRFYHSRDERNKNGTGLGLVIAKEIANRHDIEIEIESTINVGTTVKLLNFIEI